MDGKNMLSNEELDKVVGGAAKVVAADDAASTTKSIENTVISIVKNGKKFSATGVNMK